MWEHQHRQKISGISSPLLGRQPALLISLIHPSEAATFATTGYPNIVDLKNPSAGSIGLPPYGDIAKTRKLLPAHVPLSVAIGDADMRPDYYGNIACQAAGAGADIIKVGLYDIPIGQEAVFIKKVAAILHSNHPAIPLVPLFYADRLSAGMLEQLPEIAESAGTSICMLDTFGKAGGNLLSYISLPQLKRFIQNCRLKNRLSGLAGSLTMSEAKVLLPLSPSIIGFRSAVCSGERGSMGLSEKKISAMLAEFRN